MNRYPVILAIDYGTRRVGVAISRGSLAEPLTILPQDETVFDALTKILTEEQVERIIVGLSENEMAEKTQAFVEVLRTKTNLPIQLVDETLSSQTVHTKLKDAGAPLRVRQQPIDDRAAALFLQEYLDDSV